MTAAVLDDTERAARQAVIVHLRSCGYTGKGFAGITRNAFTEQVDIAIDRARADIRGGPEALLNRAAVAAGVWDEGLFTGPWSHAQKWASDDLLAWWAEHGRPTYDEYVADLLRSARDELDAVAATDIPDDVSAIATTGEDTPMTATLDTPAPIDHPTVYAEVPAELLDQRPARKAHGAMVLDDARAFYRRHFYFPSTVQADLFTVWTAGLTHMRDHNHKYVGSTAPRCYVRASTAGAGKSLLGTFIELTGGRGEVVFAPATTQYGVIQMIAEGNKTVVLDNFDEVKGGKRDGQRDVLLAGMYDYSSLLRSGRREEPEAYVLGPVAITAIGDRLRRNEAFKPVVERSVIVDVSKRPKDDTSTERFDRRDREHLARAESIRRACEAWGRDVAPDFVGYRPGDLPVSRMSDREVDVWEPLVAIADLADGRRHGDAPGVWGQRIRRALAALVLNEAVDADEDDDPFATLTPSQRTMAEVAHVLGEHDDDSITTVELLERMADLPGGGRWAVADGTERQRLLKARTMALSADLATFGVTRSSVKVPKPDGSGDYVNGWWARDVLPFVPADLPVFRASDLERHAKNTEEEDVPFD